MSSKSIRHTTLVVLFIFAALTTRFIKLNWGNGFFFHPDENNMATAIGQLSPRNLNPNFYAYGQFPLYLSYFTGVILNVVNRSLFIFKVDFIQAILILRFYSALASLISLFMAYKISHYIFTTSFPRWVFLVFLIFNPGLIQLAHFGTTESLLILVFLSNIYYGLKYSQSPRLKYLLISAVISATGLASKLTAFIFIIPIVLSLLFGLIKQFSGKIIVHSLIFAFILFSLTAAFSPYNIIKYQDFISSMHYETAVATGAMKVFYTNQFLYSVPYFFQISKIFPYSSGIFLFVMALAGLFAFILIPLAKNKALAYPSFYNWSLILVPSLVYFLYFGQLYVKWFRFMSPLFFLLPLFAAFFVSHVKSKTLSIIIALICIIPGFLFLNLYLHPDIRLSFSRWFEEKVPENSIILSEAGNVMNLPLTSKSYNITNFDFYNLDQNPELVRQLPSLVAASDYILIPSRRIFKNQSNSHFPYSQNYYSNLFIGQLGFTQVAIFTPDTSLFLTPENAEETYSVFDQPTIRLYKKTKVLTPRELDSLLIAFYQ